MASFADSTSNNDSQATGTKCTSQEKTSARTDLHGTDDSDSADASDDDSTRTDTTMAEEMGSKE